MDTLREKIQKTYTQVLENDKDQGCECSPSCCSGTSGFSEKYDGVKGYYPEADYGMGCGLPTENLPIKKGDTVLDLGSGAGNDAFVVRELVGEKGHVLGIDFTEAMVSKAKQNAQKLKYENVEFILGDIEHMPFYNDSIDCIISNCVLNLVSDKKKAYQEIFRVLRTGGHFNISDIVLNKILPPEIQMNPELYAGCVSGAILKESYIGIIEETGFKNVRITSSKPSTIKVTEGEKHHEITVDRITIAGEK